MESYLNETYLWTNFNVGLSAVLHSVKSFSTVLDWLANSADS